MEDNKVNTEDIKGKTVEEAVITNKAVVIKFTDGTFLDVYVDDPSYVLKISSNKIED